MLTPKQEKFVQNIIEGMSQADAYRSAYNTKRMTDKSIHEAASRLMNDSKIASRVQELRDQLEDESIMSAKERLKWLTKIIKSENETTADKLRASDQMNKMQGEYTQKVQASFTYEDSLKKVVDENEY